MPGNQPHREPLIITGTIGPAMAKIDRTTDLTETEGEPTAGADVDLPQTREDFEDFKVRARWGRFSGISIGTRTAPGSLLSTATTIALLTACGCAWAGTLAAIGAPTWVKISGLIVPAAFFFALRLINRGSQRGLRRSRSEKRGPGQGAGLRLEQRAPHALQVVPVTRACSHRIGYMAICASPVAKLHIATKQAELVILFSGR